MAFKKVGVFGPKKRLGVRRMTYLQQASHELAREEAHPDHVAQAFMEVGSETILNQVQAEKRGHAVRALYWKLRGYFWLKIATRAEVMHERTAELRNKRNAQNKRAGVTLRSGRY